VPRCTPAPGGLWSDSLADHTDGRGEERQPQDEAEHADVADEEGEEPGPDENPYKAAGGDPGRHPPVQVPPHQVAGGAGERGKYDHKEPGPDGDGLREPEVEVHESGA